MKRLLSCLEEKGMLVFALTGLAALTVIAAVTVYQVRIADENGDQVVETQAESDGLLAAADDGVLQEPNEIPDAQEVGSQTLVTDETGAGTQEPAVGESVPVQAEAAALQLAYNGTKSLSWPVNGRKILRDYSMDSTVYYATLNQYKVSSGVLIQEEPGCAVKAPADCVVSEIGTSEEIGTYAVLKLGDEYTAVLGNLDEVMVSENQYLLRGTVIGTLAQPTKYASVEGPNLYLEIRENSSPVDPLVCLE